MFWGHEMGWNWMMFGGLTMLFFWGGLILLVVLAFRALQNPRPTTGSNWEPTRETPLYIVSKRYAKGEISKDEFEEMKRTLTA